MKHLEDSKLSSWAKAFKTIGGIGCGISCIYSLYQFANNMDRGEDIIMFLAAGKLAVIGVMFLLTCLLTAAIFTWMANIEIYHDRRLDIELSKLNPNARATISDTTGTDSIQQPDLKALDSFVDAINNN